MENKGRTNCPNCGAVLNEHGHCNYCGTQAKEPIRSGINITSDSITVWCDTWSGNTTTIKPEWINYGLLHGVDA